MKVWAIDIAVMKIRRIVVGRVVMAVIESIEMATRFMWIPGMRPVKVPAKMPRRNEIISVSILICLLLFGVCFCRFLDVLGILLCLLF